MGVFRQTGILPDFDWDAPRVNVQSDDIYPTSVGEILAPDDDGRLVAASASWLFMPWKPGLTWAEWSKTRRGCNNARGEEADAKWPFGPAAKRGRCLIPGEAFFEWNDDPPKAKDGSGGKTEYRFAYPDGRAFFFAGLCNRVEPPDAGPMLTYTMITKAAGGDTAAIGHRRADVGGPAVSDLRGCEAAKSATSRGSLNLLWGGPLARVLIANEAPTQHRGCGNDRHMADTHE